ncbi:MAG: hypothetical protein AB7O62_03880 [Pirellulales bacterium]
MFRTTASAAALLACAAMFVWAADESPKPKDAKAGDTQKVRLHVSGAYCLGCAGVLTDALADGGVENATKVPANRARGYVIVLGDIAKDFDLSKLAVAVNEADTPHKKQAKPGVALELFASLDETTAPKAVEALADIKGVDAKHSSANVETGAISIKLSGEEKVTVASLIGALKKGGIDAKVVTDAPAPVEEAE